MIASARTLYDLMAPASRSKILFLILPMLIAAALEMASIGIMLPVIYVLFAGDTGPLRRLDGVCVTSGPEAVSRAEGIGQLA